MLIGKIGDTAYRRVEDGTDIPDGWVELFEDRPSPPHKWEVSPQGGWVERVPEQESAYHERMMKYREQVNDFLLAAMLYRLEGDEQKAQQSEQKALQRYRKIKQEHPHRGQGNNNGNGNGNGGNT